VRNDLSFHLLGSGAEVDQPKNKTTVLNPDLYIFSVYGLTLEEKNNPEEKMGIDKEDFEKLNMRGIVISSMMTAFGLVVALAWKDTIKATVEFLMRDYADEETLMGMYVTAVAVTALVMGLAMVVLKLNARVEKEIERVQSYFDDEDENEEESKES